MLQLLLRGEDKKLEAIPGQVEEHLGHLYATAICIQRERERDDIEDKKGRIRLKS